MATTNWTIIRKNKKNGEIHLTYLQSKWTYKTAVGIAQEATKDEHELVCVVETSKIMLNNDNKEIQKEELPIG